MSLVAYGSSDTDSSGSSSGSGSGGEGPAPAQPAQPAQPAPRAQARLQAQLQAQAPAPLHQLQLQLQAATPGPGPGPTITRARAPRGNKRRQAARVHIHIHAPELGEASDSDDEGPFQKKSSPASAAGMGLSALLPQPRNLTLKETNRTLLPHAFTRPPKATGRAAPGRATVTTTTTPSPSAIKAASKNAAKQLARHIMNEKASDEEEDEEEEAEGGELSFFSLSDRQQPPPPAVAAARTEVYPCARADQSPPPCPDPTDPSDVLNPADAPLEFNRSVSSLGDAGLAANSAPELGGQYPDYHGQEGEQSKYYQNYYDEYYQGLEPAPTPAPEEEHDTFMNDEAFKRLQGKRNRGKEEVSFVEIKGDDQLSGSQQWLMKSLTEEKDMKSFSKKRGEQPTSQQRRKHQITYLIHQAKERELELKNAWSDNRLTKRQTQAKYGF